MRIENIYADPNVGGGLPPMAVCQSIQCWLIHCNQGQAPLPPLIALQKWAGVVG
ncbi:hypothetical protein C4J97_4816 [Pseudomonas orientalis]|nr:hypothetical protein C4J97_4816 [Pseudomonas orientalis]